jgi:hypothetical protein
MQACAAGYALIYATTPKLQLVSSTAVGLTAAKFTPLIFFVVKVKVALRLTGSQSVSQSVNRSVSLAYFCCQSQKVRVTLRLAVYRQLVRIGYMPLEDHDQRFFPIELLW